MSSKVPGLRLEPASNSTSRRQTVLVLGDAGVGARICERLTELGFTPHLRTPPALNSTHDDLRAFLKRFASEQSAIPDAGTLWLHPGVTPIAERNEWPVVSRELGFTFIGPPARSLSIFNNRLSLLGEAEKISISNLLLSQDPLHSVREIEKLIRTNKFKLPCVLKSVRGGSGSGVRVIHQLDDLGKSLSLWLDQNRRNLGEVIVLAERYVEGARRVVQPFVRFADGHVELFPLVDASLTSRLRKIIEFCPAYGEDEEFKLVRDWTRALAQRTGYVGVGSLEYLVDGTRCYLIEGVPRLNTSFDLWENVMGTSAVAWQLAAMAGPGGREMPGRLERREWKTAVSLRIYAEDPILQLPQPGAVRELSAKRKWIFPGSVARLDLAVKEGDVVTPMGSSVLGYLLIGAEDRKRAVTVARGLLEEMWIAGSIQTNERFLHELLTHPWVQEGMFHASFVDEEFIPSVRPDAELIHVFGRMAQLLSQGEPGAAQAKWAVGDQWIKAVPEDEVQWKSGPEYFQVGERKGLSGVFQSIKGPALRACCYPLSGDRWQARVGGWFLTVRRVNARPGPKPGVPPTQKLSSLVSGRVHSILFREGSWVSAHEPALLVESLGMLVPHALPVDVRVVRWHVGSEDMVHAGQLLAEFERGPQAR